MFLSLSPLPSSVPKINKTHIKEYTLAHVGREVEQAASFPCLGGHSGCQWAEPSAGFQRWKAWQTGTYTTKQTNRNKQNAVKGQNVSLGICFPKNVALMTRSKGECFQADRPEPLR